MLQFGYFGALLSWDLRTFRTKHILILLWTSDHNFCLYNRYILCILVHYKILQLLLLATFPAQGREHSPLRNGLGVIAAAACYGIYAREISLLVLLLPWGQQE